MASKTRSPVASSEDEIEAFLASYPPAIVHQAGILRTLVKEVVPDAVERIRPGWRLIGYDLPGTAPRTYFAYIAPEPEHVHLGFEHGTLMSDSKRVLQGAHLGLRRVRYLTFRPGERILRGIVVGLIREGARVAELSRAERWLLAMSRDTRT